MPVDPRRPAAISLGVDDAAELVEMLTFIGDWLDSTDGPALNASLQRFVHAAYGRTDLQTDLARFAFLLGDDGDRFFGHLA